MEHSHDGSPVLGKLLSSKDVILLEKIGEGQFGDVHSGILFPDVSVVSDKNKSLLCACVCVAILYVPLSNVDFFFP